MICLHCNKELAPSKYKPKQFCNVNCKARFYYDKKYKAVKVKTNCIICFKSYITPEKQPSKFCSKKCSNYYYFNPKNPDNIERINKKRLNANKFYKTKMKELGDKREKEGLPRKLKRKFINEEERKEKRKEYSREYKQRDYVKEKTKKYNSTEDVKKRRNQLVKNWYKTEKGSKYRKEYTEKLWADKGEELKAKARTPEARAKTLKRYHRRKNIDVQYKITRVLRSQLTSAVKSYKQKGIIFKKGKTLELLGCTMKDFLGHIETQFKDGMNWNNHGLQSYKTGKKWNIDHIKAVDKFDLTIEEEQKKCFNYKNLQPLWQKENRKKWNR